MLCCLLLLSAVSALSFVKAWHASALKLCYDPCHPCHSSRCKTLMWVGKDGKDVLQQFEKSAFAVLCNCNLTEWWWCVIWLRCLTATTILFVKIGLSHQIDSFALHGCCTHESICVCSSLCWSSWAWFQDRLVMHSMRTNIKKSLSVSNHSSSSWSTHSTFCCTSPIISLKRTPCHAIALLGKLEFLDCCLLNPLFKAKHQLFVWTMMFGFDLGMKNCCHDLKACSKVT